MDRAAMWELKDPAPVKLIIGILAANRQCLDEAVEAAGRRFGAVDLRSEEWPFDSTEYYRKQIGPRILRQFISIDDLIDPGLLGAIKLMTNALERRLAVQAALPLPRPVNLDPGCIEPSKLVLATTKNYSHRIYIGRRIWAEVTLVYDKGWKAMPYTYPDYRQECYFEFFDQVRERLAAQLKGPVRVRRRLGILGGLRV
ncbi:MAG TPA: DUF4416 family protein [Phycisphaerales bacterium]|nr:DUF4416 family protein [Phycisphaerales bacterium]